MAVLIGFVKPVVSDPALVVDTCGQQETSEVGHFEGCIDECSEHLDDVQALSICSYKSLDAPRTMVDQSVHESQMKPGMKDGSIHRGEQSVYPKASVNHQSKRRQFVRMDGRSVAQELVWLITESRLTYGQLFKLQRLAKQVPGQELSDFVAYRSERLKQLTTTNDCYRYLKKFIDDGVDARYLCAQRAKQQHRTKRTSQRKMVEDVVKNWAKSFDGRTLYSMKSGKAYLVHAQSGTVEIVCEGVPANVSMKIDRRFMRTVQAGEMTLQISPRPMPVIVTTPVRCQRTDEEIQRAQTSIANMKAMLKNSLCKIQTGMK